jgi:hypothetical protein
MQTRRKVRRLSHEELQAIVDAHSSFLPDELKTRYPERSFEPNYRDLEREFPDKWIALVPTRVNAVDTVIAGRVLAVAPDRTLLDTAIAPIRADYPQLGISIFYTGRYTFGGELAIV